MNENLSIGKKASIEAKAKGADIVLFPEMWSDGYYLPQEENELKKLTISKDSDFIKQFGDLDFGRGVVKIGFYPMLMLRMLSEGYHIKDMLLC